MNKKLKQNLLIIAVALCVLPASAQLSSNPNKFLGNITTSYSVDAGGGVPAYYTLWNQITCENESKWSSVEGTRGTFNWDGADRAFNYAKNHNFTYKFHALVWGAQYPGWLENLAPTERFAAMTNWFDHAKARYEILPMIDVVNEAVGLHQKGNPLMKETLGGGGKTGYDWLIKAFEMAYERWPDAILIYNDFNSLDWDVDVNNYITLVRTLRDAGAPIDAYGNQSHDVNSISESHLKDNLKKQQDALQMPMFITELDINIADDTQQLNQYKKVLPNMWELPYCAGVTLWGYVLGATWVTNSGLYKDNGEERPAMTWIKEYMQTEVAKTAAGPFPGTKKEASIYIRPASQKVAKGDVLPIMVRAHMATKTIEKIDLYEGNNLIVTMTQAPYLAEYSSTTTGIKTLKAVVTTTDGETYERYGRIQVLSGETKRAPYNETLPELPGTIDAGEFDNGLSSVSYSGISTTVYKSRDKFSTTATQGGQWMDYTVDVKEEGLYTVDVEVASTQDGGRFHLAEYSFDNLDFLTDFIDVPNTGSTTEFQKVRCSVKKYLTAGRHVFTMLVDKNVYKDDKDENNPFKEAFYPFYLKSMTFNLLPTYSLPGVVEAEDFVGSKGGSIVPTVDGFAWGNAANGDWAEYSVKVDQAGKYSYETTVTSNASGSKFTMTLIDSNEKEINIPMVKVPNNGKDNYTVKTGNVKEALNAGMYTLRINVTGGNCFIDKVKFICTEPASGIDEIMSDDAVNGPAYNLMGVPVNAGYRGIVIKNGKKIFVK